MTSLEIISEYEDLPSPYKMPLDITNCGELIELDDPNDCFVKYSDLIPLDGQRHLLNISGLRRCVGLILIYSPRFSAADQTTYVRGLHLRPTRKLTNKAWRSLSEVMMKISSSHAVTKVIMTGGQINNHYNQVHYQKSQKFWFERMQNHPYTKEAKFVQFLPNDTTNETTVFAIENQLAVLQLLREQIVYRIITV